MNLFGSAGIKIEKEKFALYAKKALGIENAEELISALERHKIIRYAVYKSQYVIFEGTDVNLEDELLQASSRVPRSKDIVGKLASSFDFPIEFANAIYYKKGTPRYFKYIISEQPITLIPTNEIDGHINLIFNSNNEVESNTIKHSVDCEEAMLYAYFKNTKRIVDNVWEIDKLEHVKHIVDSKDKVAHREIDALLAYSKEQLRHSVLDSLFTFSNDVIWYYKGEQVSITSKGQFNKLLSSICDDVYTETPIFINEMVNKHKPSSAMSLAKFKYFEKLLNESNIEDLGFERDKFPPEKTIYKTLLQKTNIHKKQFGVYDLFAPSENSSFLSIWNACEQFMDSSSDKPKKISELSKILRTRPFKLKQGFIDLWLTTYLIIKKNDYSLYDSKGTYTPVINRDVLEIFNRSVN